VTTTVNTGAIGWFEIGSARPDEAEAFYGGLFGWSFGKNPLGGFDYRDITTGADHPLRGGLLDTGGRMPGYAVFVVVVDDVAAACEAATALGGKVDAGPVTFETGLSCAYLSDPEGNRFAVFTPPQQP
jgi:predicted enzyme related to lactoylglutathione lyase